MLSNLKVLLGRTVSAASIQLNQTTCQKAFDDGFHDEPAGNIMAFSDHTQGDFISTPWENMESTICNGLTDLAKRVWPIPVVDATLAPSYSIEGAGGLAPQPFWPLTAGTG